MNTRNHSILILVMVSSSGCGGSAPTHITAQDVCLIKAGVGALDSHDEAVVIPLFYQSSGRPLAGQKSKAAVVLKKGTGVVVLKDQIETSNIDAYKCDFVRVADGEHKGTEGWLLDKYVLPNR